MIVLDASATVDWLLQTPAGQRIEERIYTRNDTAHTVHLLDVEVAQVLRREDRRSPRSCGPDRGLLVDLACDFAPPNLRRDELTPTSAVARRKSRDDEVTKRHHGYQRVPSVLKTTRTNMEVRIHTSAPCSRRPCLALHRSALPVHCRQPPGKHQRMSLMTSV